jgi:hypothetical protein
MFPTLLITAALTVVLGLGMPTPSAYILGAAMMGPILAELQVPTLSAHMFILYYAVMSALTPPVAVAAYAASSIAEDNPLHIALLAVKFALAAFIIPFAFVYGPDLFHGHRRHRFDFIGRRHRGISQRAPVELAENSYSPGWDWPDHAFHGDGGRRRRPHRHRLCTGNNQ